MQVSQFIEQGLHEIDVCVLAAYSKQVKLIRDLLRGQNMKDVSEN